MIIKPGLPPNIEAIRKVVTPGPETVFTYGDTLYIQDIKEERIQSHLLAHEEVHARQQKDPETWWRQYLEDPKFRIEQEVEAYGEQYAWVVKNVPIKKIQAQFLFKLAADLSGPTYGNAVSFGEAESKIRRYPHTRTAALDR